MTHLVNIGYASGCEKKMLNTLSTAITELVRNLFTKTGIFVNTH